MQIAIVGRRAEATSTTRRKLESALASNISIHSGLEWGTRGFEGRVEFNWRLELWNNLGEIWRDESIYNGCVKAGLFEGIEFLEIDQIRKKKWLEHERCLQAAKSEDLSALKGRTRDFIDACRFLLGYGEGPETLWCTRGDNSETHGTFRFFLYNCSGRVNLQ